MKQTLCFFASCLLTWTPSSAFTINTRTVTLQKPSPLIQPRLKPSTALNYGELRGVDSQLLFDTWEWCANLGAPAALVAGAVLATMVESRSFLEPKRADHKIVRFAKKATRFLLMTSFGLEVISIFVTTVTGTMLLSHGDALGALKSASYNSPMGFLMHNWEFEYLTSRICFLQGLFHWLASVALEQLIPKDGEGLAARHMNRFTASALLTILVGMLSFLNRHMTFYKNYFGMWKHYSVVVFKQFVWPLRPLTILMAPMAIATLYFGYQALIAPPDLEEE